MSKNPQAKVLSTYELMQMFPDEDAAIKYLAGILWPNGPVCPRCQSQNTNPYASKKHFHRCNGCGKDFSIQIGTVFECSHIPLQRGELQVRHG